MRLVNVNNTSLAHKKMQTAEKQNYIVFWSLKCAPSSWPAHSILSSRWTVTMSDAMVAKRHLSLLLACQPMSHTSWELRETKLKDAGRGTSWGPYTPTSSGKASSTNWKNFWICSWQRFLTKVEKWSTKTSCLIRKLLFEVGVQVLVAVDLLLPHPNFNFMGKLDTKEKWLRLLHPILHHGNTALTFFQHWRGGSI